ncbi:MAG: hypothetical protein JNL60_03630 [Bacteroidia bacterium]|nr:hypothetical protein [Bacteroidia bacterium]
MKKNKHIRQVNLVLFLISFFLFSLNNFAGITKNNDKIGAVTVSAKQNESPASNLQLSENENEKENDFELLAFVIPFFFLSFIIEIFRRTIFSYPASINKAACPIYVSVRNFRI